MTVRKGYVLDTEYLSPPEVAGILPATTATSVRKWAAAGELPGAIRLPSGRWQIPWSAVIGILGFDPRGGDGASASGSADVAS